MSTALDIAKQNLLSPGGMGENEIQKVLDQLLTYQVDAADLYFEMTRSES